MAVFAVMYQLNKDKDYPKLWEELDRLDGHKAQNSLYLLSLTNESAQEVCDHLQDFIDDNDYLFVAKLQTRPAKKGCYKGTKAWLDEHF